MRTQRASTRTVLHAQRQMAPAVARTSAPTALTRNFSRKSSCPLYCVRRKSARIMQESCFFDCGPTLANHYLQLFSFGYGKQACPGRFLAVRQLKLVLAKLLLRYDFRWASGKPPKRFSKMVIEGQIFPDISTQIALKRREGIEW